MNLANEAKRLEKRYKKYGITKRDIMKHIQSGRAAGFSDEAALTGVRLALAHEFGEHEYFSSADIANALGLTVDEVNNTIEEHKPELLEHGEIVSIDPAVFQMLGGR